MSILDDYLTQPHVIRVWPYENLHEFVKHCLFVHQCYFKRSTHCLALFWEFIDYILKSFKYLFPRYCQHSLESPWSQQRCTTKTKCKILYTILRPPCLPSWSFTQRQTPPNLLMSYTLCPADINPWLGVSSPCAATVLLLTHAAWLALGLSTVTREVTTQSAFYPWPALSPINMNTDTTRTETWMNNIQYESLF